MSRQEDDHIEALFSAPRAVTPLTAPDVQRQARHFPPHEVEAITTALTQTRTMLASVRVMSTCPGRLRHVILTWDADRANRAATLPRQPVHADNVDGLRRLAQRGIALLDELLIVPKLMPRTRALIPGISRDLARVIDLLAQPAGQSTTIIDRPSSPPSSTAGAQRAAAS